MLEKIRHFFREKNEINYLYFIIFFASVSIFSLSHLFFWEEPLSGARFFFLLYALGQAFLEVWTLILISVLLKRWTPTSIFYPFIALSFLILLLHFASFTLLRLMDASIGYVFKFLFGRGLNHLTTAFFALGMNMETAAVILILLLSIPFLGLFLYWGTSRIVRLIPWKLSLQQIIRNLAMTGMSLICLELCTHSFIERPFYNKLHKGLPLGGSLYPPDPHCIELKSPLARPLDERLLRQKIPLLNAEKKPNLYFFVIETLRKDFITPETAPHLTDFASKNINIASSYANSNWTPLSWFSLFHSNLPFHWTSVRDEWREGSLALSLLQQLGYEIYVYSSTDLSYFNMDRAVFGENRSLAAHIEEQTVHRDMEPCDRDLLCMDSFERHIKTEEGKSGRAYLFFLDATHSEYSFPKNVPLRFEPIAKHIDYLTLTQKNIEPIKNRYRNAIHFIDSLMGRFFHLLEEQGLQETAIIAITGDHGEEFYEEGSLFHGTHLNRYQTEVPIYLRFPPPLTLEGTLCRATHIDLFPSILHALTGSLDFAPLFDGESLFLRERRPYRVAVLQNGADTPTEFCVVWEKEGAEKHSCLQARYLHPQDMDRATLLEVLASQGMDNLDFLDPFHGSRTQ